MLQRVVSRHNSNLSQETVSEKSVSKLQQDFTLGELLGKGGFGQIIKVRHKCDENEYAIKIIKYDESNSADMSKKKKEAQMLSVLDHHNIVRYYNSWVETAQVPIVEYNKMFTPNSEESFSDEICKLSDNGYLRSSSSETDTDDDELNEEEDDSNNSSIVFENGDDEEYKTVSYLCIQMELCVNRTLRTAIDENLYQEEKKLTQYFTEICEALSYMHKKNIIHRDLKPENIFLTSNDVIKIGDFGLSKEISLMSVLEPNEGLSLCSSNSLCGTPIYIAPEVRNGQQPYSIKSDMYSLGVIYLEMCSKPMTGMELQSIIPMSKSKLEKLIFSPKRKHIISNLLSLNDEKRPTCCNLLEFLNSQKSLDEIKSRITQKRHLPEQHIRPVFCGLENLRKNEIRMSLLTSASKIFEQHGGQNIPMPTFLPPLNNLTDNLTTLLNKNGKQSSISNTSRIAFSCFVALNNIKKIRRYSVGKVFEEGFFQPTEMQECVLHCLSPETNDSLSDAEMLDISKTIHDKIALHSEEEIRFYINHRLIFLTLLKLWGIKDQKAWTFTNIMTTLSNKISTSEDIISQLSSLELDKNTMVLISKMITPRTIPDAEKQIRTSYSLKNLAVSLGAAFAHLETIVNMAQNFGIKSENIFLSPLLITQKQSSGFMFKMETKQEVLATGGNFEPLIKKFKKKSRQNKRIDFSAVELSLNVENYVDYLNRHRPKSPAYQLQLPAKPEVLIRAREKHEAIPLYRKLLSLDLKCEIITSSNGTILINYIPYVIVLKTNLNRQSIVRTFSELTSSIPVGLRYSEIDETNFVKVYVPEEPIRTNDQFRWLPNYKEVYCGDWTHSDFEKIFSKKVV